MTVDWEEVRSTQRLVKGHLRVINHIFNPGGNTSKRNRVWRAKELKSTVLPVNSLLVKDHKELMPEGLPKTRPVCGACRSINGELSEWITEILGAACLCQGEDDSEAISGEEMRAELDKVAKELEEQVPKIHCS